MQLHPPNPNFNQSSNATAKNFQPAHAPGVYQGKNITNSHSTEFLSPSDMIEPPFCPVPIPFFIFTVGRTVGILRASELPVANFGGQDFAVRADWTSALAYYTEQYNSRALRLTGCDRQPSYANGATITKSNSHTPIRSRLQLDNPDASISYGKSRIANLRASVAPYPISNLTTRSKATGAVQRRNMPIQAQDIFDPSFSNQSAEKIRRSSEQCAPHTPDKKLTDWQDLFPRGFAFTKEDEVIGKELILMDSPQKPAEDSTVGKGHLVMDSPPKETTPHVPSVSIPSSEISPHYRLPRPITYASYKRLAAIYEFFKKLKSDDPFISSPAAGPSRSMDSEQLASPVRLTSSKFNKIN